VLTTCQPSTVWCSRERLPAAAAQPAKVRQSCSATDYYYFLFILPVLPPMSKPHYVMYKSDPRIKHAFVSRKIVNNATIMKCAAPLLVLMETEVDAELQWHNLKDTAV
jgi:hypothetical protein